jgi:DNA-binding MarR family transcriptional regulator
MEQEHDDTAINDFVMAIGLLVRRIRAMHSAHELSLTESAVMARLERGGPATISDLARGESMKSQSMGATVAALEERGLVERRPHPTDGRQVHIVLTAKGIDVRAKIRAEKQSWLAEVILQLDEQERATLFAAGDIIKRLAEK